MLVFLLLMTTDIVLFAQEEKPVVAVLAFECRGVKHTDMQLLVDIISINILETGKCHVIGRLEQKKLLAGFEYIPAGRMSEKEYREAGERLFADFLIGGYITDNGRTIEFIVELYDVTFSLLLKTETYALSSFEEMVLQARPISRKLLKTIEATYHGINPGLRVFESLSPVPIKERIPFLLPKGVLNETGAELKRLANRVLYEMLSSGRFIPYLAETTYTDGAINTAEVIPLLAESKCHYAAAVMKEDSGYSFVVYGINLIRLHTVVINTPFEPVFEAKRIAQSIEEELPFLSQEILAYEIKSNIMVE
jgi:hypothetical protein